ncbi:hypothetical protein ANCCAN_25490 [Ancylostoma caninum]|uniref:Uncharacterized protein n=1 Tax=Ancylostoma caninum TaxID=29170 RepID=A0A368F9C0_ANCCA|nr:hypothetical protein ANCCAN_25490 [Ancylostoma caninum]
MFFLQISNLLEEEQPTGVRLRLRKGSYLEGELSLKEVDLSSVQRLRLRVKSDRIVLLADNTRSLYDFCVPFYLDPTNAHHKLNAALTKLAFSVPVVYP